MTTLITNAHIISPNVDLENASILIEDKFIKQIFNSTDPLPTADNVVDAENMMVMPGFIDVHSHGRSGIDFCDAQDEVIERIAIDKLKEGITTYLPTTLTLGETQLADALKTAANYVKNGSVGCKIPGVHLEGPFINSGCLGAQNPDYVRLPDIEEIKRLNDIFPVLKVSFAIEVTGAPLFAAQLLATGITPSCVHSAATFDQFTDGYNHGLRNLSHYCNQMTPLHHRDIGLVGAGLDKEDVYVEMICDKLHICPDMIRLLFKLKDYRYIQLVTDSMRASGLPDGLSDIGGLPVVVKNGEARLASNGALAGSTLQFNHSLRNIYEITKMPLSKLVTCSSYNQAQALGLERIGKIASGFYADIVFLDDNFNVDHVYINGIRK